MNASVAIDAIPEIPTRAREITRRQIQESFTWMDAVLDIHRSNFVFRQPTAKELEEHKIWWD